MDKINKAAAAGVIFFSVVLAGFVGIKVDPTTIALLGGAFIGLVVAIPTTALIMVIGLRDERRQDAPPAQPKTPEQPQFWNTQPPQVTHNHFHDHKYIVVVQVPANADDVLKRWTVARELNTTPTHAQHMIDAGEVRFTQQLPTPKSS